MPRRIIVGNWKMHGTKADAVTFAEALGARLGDVPAETACIVCPPAILLPVLAPFAADKFSLGAQDCHAQPAGPYTGDLSAPMLREYGCGYVLLGHSERRLGHHESDQDVAAKADAANLAGMTPIYCVGEPLDVRQFGGAEDYVARQLDASLSSNGGETKLIVAYEPIWAIGTGQVALPADIEAMHAFLRRFLLDRGWTPAETLSILYGGSVKPENAAEILNLPSVGGVLVGGASLNAESFSAILHAV